MVGSRQFWETRFASQLEQALTTPELIALPEVQRKLVWVSADATPTRLGAIDWSGRVALACEAAPLLLPLTHPRSELEGGSSVARFEPGDDLVQIGVAELLALLVLVAARKEEWSGSVVLYLGDNTNVQDWLLKRQAGNSQANFLLKVLGALEGVHGLHVRGAYLRTYHNQTADDLTRLEPGEVMRNLGLERIEVPSDWSKVLEEAWVKRALLWLGQPEADRGVALQLAERRAGPQMPRALPALRWRVWEMGPPESRLCVVASVSGEAEARRVLCKAPSEAESLWIDSFRPLPLDALKSATHADAWELWGQEYDGRSFQDQVWWKRWVIAGVRKGSPGELEDFFQDRRAELEPCTPLLHTYATHWVDPKPKQGWVTGTLKLDPTFPFLGPRAPKPCGTLRTQGGERALVWDPTKPLPPLHENSWEVTRADALHLLSHGEEGVQVRVVQPREVFKLLGGRGWHASEDAQQDALDLLAAPPYALASLAAQWVGLVSLVSEEAPSRSRLGFKEGQGEPGELAPEQRTGACYLAWEQETEELVKHWLAERFAAPSRAGAMSQWGSKRKEEKAQRLRGSFRARSDADRRRLVKILRHEAHFLGIPVREDGWVSLRDLNYYVGTTSREDLEVLAGRDNKQRMVLYTDRETWIAAESGHSMSGVVRPGRELSAAEVPALLVHGSYAEHTNSIYRHGLQARRAIHLLEIGSRHGRWRADLETAVFVRAQAAAARGTRFLFTTNNLYLAPQGIAAASRMEALEVEGQRAAARGEESRSQRHLPKPAPPQAMGCPGAKLAPQRLMWDRFPPC